MRESHTRLLDYGRVSCRSTERTSGQTKVVGSHHNPILVLNGEDGCTCYYRLSSKSSAKSRLVVNRRRTVCAGHPRRKCQLRLDVGGWDMSRMGQRHHCAMTSQTRGITEKCLRTYRAAPVCRKVVHGRRCWEELWSESREPDASSETFTVRASCTFAHVTSHTYIFESCTNWCCLCRCPPPLPPFLVSSTPSTNSIMAAHNPYTRAPPVAGNLGANNPLFGFLPRKVTAPQVQKAIVRLYRTCMATSRYSYIYRRVSSTHSRRSRIPRNTRRFLNLARSSLYSARWKSS